MQRRQARQRAQLLRAARGVTPASSSTRQRVELGDDPAKMQEGLAKLTLTIMEVIRQTLERQAVRRVDSGTLTEDEIERMGLAFMLLHKKIIEIAEKFGIKREELKATLGSLMKTGDPALDNSSLIDVLDRLLEGGAVVAGRVKISVADVDLVGLDLLAMLYPIYGERRWLDDKPVRKNGD